MSYTNQYMRGQIWAQAVHRGRGVARALESSLTTERFGKRIAAFLEVTSTNVIATQWAAEGAPEGAVVMAEHQVKGRGRHGRDWEDAPGKNLLFSLLLRPPMRFDQLGLVMLASCVSVASALLSVDPSLPVSIKWPNDLLIRGRKCGGLLMETSTSGGSVSSAVVGIGLNVNQDEFPELLAAAATSVALEAGRLFDHNSLLAAILNRLEDHYDRLLLDQGASVREAYMRLLDGLGASVRVYSFERASVIEGRITGISDVGELLLETAEGTRTLASGEVTFHSGEAA